MASARLSTCPAPVAQRGKLSLVRGRMGFNNGNEPQTIQQVSATLWYRPIQAIKFGLQYSYLAANYFQMNTLPR